MLTETEFENMGMQADIDGVDSGIDRAYVISSSLSNTRMLDSKGAQALAFRAIADVGRERTADETGMSTYCSSSATPTIMYLYCQSNVGKSHDTGDPHHET